MMSHRTWFYKIATCLFRLWPSFDHKHGGHQQPLEKGLLLNTAQNGWVTRKKLKNIIQLHAPKGDPSKSSKLQGKATPEKHTSGVWKWWTFQQSAPVFGDGCWGQFGHGNFNELTVLRRLGIPGLLRIFFDFHERMRRDKGKQPLTLT